MAKNVCTELAIWMNGLHVGLWRITSSGQNELTYNNASLAAQLYGPISLSLKERLPGNPVMGAAVVNYFDNLLPDLTDTRRSIANVFQIEKANVFNLLGVIGRDCVGAVQLLPPGELPTDFSTILATEMTEDQVKEHLNCIPNVTSLTPRSSGAHVRSALPGAQEKSALLELNGKWWMPHGSTPTNRILKLALGSIGGGVIPLHDSIANEWLCAQIIAGFELPIAKCEMKDFAGTPALSVHRFDREEVDTPSGTTIYRLPQEDFCQVLGVPPHLKYESEGGPGFTTIAGVLKSSLNAERDLITLFQAQVLFWMLLGIDGHAKNFSIRLLPEGRFHLAPLYDVISMWPYAGHGAGKASLHKLKMAMSVVGESGKHYVWSKIQRRHFEHMGKMVGIADPAGIIDQVVARTPSVVRGVLAQLPADFPEAISQAILSGLVESALKLGRSPSSA